jgi:hypothetical protein
VTTTVVLHRHLRELGYCNRGSRQFCNRHNLDWAEFLNSGIEAERLLATNDAMAARVVAQAERDQDGQQ